MWNYGALCEQGSGCVLSSVWLVVWVFESIYAADRLGQSNVSVPWAQMCLALWGVAFVVALFSLPMPTKLCLVHLVHLVWERMPFPPLVGGASCNAIRTALMWTQCSLDSPAAVDAVSFFFSQS